MKKFLFLAVSLLCAAPAFADDEKMLPTLPADGVRLTLSESADVTVDHDRVAMTLRAEAEGGTSDMVQNDVNRRMTEALNIARRYEKIKIVTGSYNVYQTGKDRLWRAGQTLTLDSADATQLLKLAGELQKIGLVASGMNYYLSDEKAATYRGQLLREATKKLNAQAQELAKALGKTRIQIITLNVGGSYRPPVMYKAMRMESMAMSADMAAPVGDGGEQKVSASVDAMVYLLP